MTKTSCQQYKTQQIKDCYEAHKKYIGIIDDMSFEDMSEEEYNSHIPDRSVYNSLSDVEFKTISNICLVHLLKELELAGVIKIL